MAFLLKLFGIPPKVGFSLHKNSWNVVNLDDSSGQISKLVVEYVGTSEEVAKIEKAIKCAIYTADL